MYLKEDKEMSEVIPNPLICGLAAVLRLAPAAMNWTREQYEKIRSTKEEEGGIIVALC